MPGAPAVHRLAGVREGGTPIEMAEGARDERRRAPSAKAQRVFVTGGSGFVGRRLLAELAARGASVMALARSSEAAATVAARGATPVAGDLQAAGRLARGMAGCDLVVHAAAKTNEWGRPEDFWATNLGGTRNVMTAARRAGVRRVVHVSTEAVLAGGQPIVDADEQAPYPARPAGLYAASKQAAERAALDADGPDLTCVAVRPRLVWGADDSALLPGLVAAMRRRQWVWWGAATHPTSTCHVANLCEGILAAAERGRGGQAYFLTDGADVPLRGFFEDLVATQGVRPFGWRLPRPLAPWVARLGEGLWRHLPLPGSPPLEGTTLALTFTQVTVSDAKARRELGYRGHVSHSAGLAELRAQAAQPAAHA